MRFGCARIRTNSSFTTMCDQRGIRRRVRKFSSESVTETLILKGISGVNNS
jgi:hypothetical protein